MATRTCKTCSLNFYVKPSLAKMGCGKYCSRACHHAGMKKRQELDCFICRVKIYKTKSQLKRAKSRKYFCGKSCQTRWRNSVFVGNKHKNWKHGEGVDYRQILIGNCRKAVCVLCGTNDNRVLAVHHIDQNKKNNIPDNLTWLCHNCHHEVHYDKVGKQKLARVLL